MDEKKVEIQVQKPTTVEIQKPKVEHGDDVVIIALVINIIDAILKFIAAYLTSSKSLFAEGIHTSIDTLNQAILYIGKFIILNEKREEIELLKKAVNIFS
uniref:Cation diffusion facilitator family transporter n=1 Tax=Panagrolaimus davidi TaxID=227884 RepID=A0A914QN27_9BILA